MRALTSSCWSWAYVDGSTASGRKGWAAYLAGFRRALYAGAELVLEMDCDFSHDPTTSRGCSRLRSADVVLGSRPFPAAAVENWGALRRFISAGGSLYARSSSCARPGLTGGFKCSRRAVLEATALDADPLARLRVPIELTYRALRKGFRVQEIPIRFVDREVGGSKMSGDDRARGDRKVPLIRLAALGGRL